MRRKFEDSKQNKKKIKQLPKHRDKVYFYFD